MRRRHQHHLRRHRLREEAAVQLAIDETTRPRSLPRQQLWTQMHEDAAAVAGIEKKLTSHLGARVAILHTPKKGRIVIEYRGNDDLQRLLEKLGVES